MPLEIIRHDITKLAVDAIVNAANESLLGGGGVDGAIHRAAGPGLLAECRTLHGCKVGEAKITGGYELPCRYVIHTVGPRWRGGSHGEEALLSACYRNSLALAVQNRCASVAFPLISSGVYAYPKDQALRVAMDSIRDFLLQSEEELTVYLVVFDKASFHLSSKLHASIAEYIDDTYVSLHADSRRVQARRMEEECFAMAAPMPSLEEALSQLDESFSAAVLRMIDEKGLTDPECYKKANLDRKLFSKLRKDSGYHPSKQTAIALAIALELSLPETQALLQKAGFALSHSDVGDIIIEFFILNGRYDIFELNTALYEFDQVPLGGKL